jgi:hypothetical protein
LQEESIHEVLDGTFVTLTEGVSCGK